MGRLAMLRSDTRDLDDPLLEFVAQVVARELGQESGLVQDENESNEPDAKHEQSRRLRPLLH